MAARAGATKNPQPLPAVGSCQIIRSTSTDGVADYDDLQDDSLRDVFQHCGLTLKKTPRPVKPGF